MGVFGNFWEERERESERAIERERVLVFRFIQSSSHMSIRSAKRCLCLSFCRWELRHKHIWGPAKWQKAPTFYEPLLLIRSFPEVGEGSRRCVSVIRKAQFPPRVWKFLRNTRENKGKIRKTKKKI